MNRASWNGLTVLIARLVIAGMFIRAALPKIEAPVEFASAVQGFQLIGPALSAWVAIGLPWLELVIGLGLLVPYIRRTSGSLIIALLLLFIGLHTSAWARGLDISCGCFGTESGESSGYLWLILRNSALLLATVLVLKRDFRNPPLRSRSL